LSVARSRCLSAALALARCPTSSPESLYILVPLRSKSFLTSETENRRTEDGRYADAPAIEDISVRRKVSYCPFAFSPELDKAADGFGAVVAESHQTGGNLSTARRIILTVQGPSPFIKGLERVLTMLTTMIGIFIVLSIGILVVHALEAFRADSRN
jgi:hypothetical protein